MRRRADRGTDREQQDRARGGGRQRGSAGSWDTNRARTGARTASLVALSALLVAVVAPGVSAEPDDPPDGMVDVAPEFEESAPFRDGHWIGTLSAAGPVSTSFDEAAISMHTAMSGTFDVLVSDDVVDGGSWNLSGSSHGTIATGFGDGAIGNAYGGTGEVTGDEDTVVLGGGLDTTWRMTFGGSTDVSQDPQRLGPFEVAVTHANCRRLIGNWESAFAAEIERAGGWESSLSGSFEATHTEEPPDSDLLDDIHALGEEYNAWVEDVRDGVYTDIEQGGTNLTDRSLDPMFDLLDDLYQIERQLGDLGGDEACLFGQDLGHYSFLLTAALQDLAWWLLGIVDDFTAADLELLGRGLLAVGGLGDGAIRPERAAQLEERWVERANEVLEDALFDDQEPDCTPSSPCLDATDEVVSLVVFGAQMRFTFEVIGVTIDPDTAGSMLADLEDE